MVSDFPRGYPSRYALPDDFHLVCMLSNIGVTTPNRSLTFEEISERTRMEVALIEKLVPKLIRDGYVAVTKTDLKEKYYLTLNGIRKVLSTYS